MCDDSFTDMAAEAICRNMNYGRANRWTSSVADNEIDFHFTQLRWNYDVKLDDVICETPNWGSCSYRLFHNCANTEGVFLSCQGIEREFLLFLK